MLSSLASQLVWPRVVQAIILSGLIGTSYSVFAQSCPSPCPQPVPPACPCSPHGVSIDTCSYPNNHGCPNGYAPAQGICCCSGSPVLISLIENVHSEPDADAFPLTTLADGVRFSITADPKVIYPVSWTVEGAQVAFVVHLPSNYIPGKPYIFNGADLFGNFSPQPAPVKGHPANGYAALLVWDLPENGGNGDGAIGLSDRAVQLGIAPSGIALWIDDNHDGIAQPGEMFTFRDKGVEGIVASQYRESHWTDSAGNKFRYAAPVQLSSGRKTRSFDVFLVLGQADN